MTEREKLTNIVCCAIQNECVGHCNHKPCTTVEIVVDDLITNGVTVQQWRDAKTDPPTKDGQYLTFISCEEGEWIETDEFDTTSKMWRTVDAYHEDATEFVTHWMPKLGTPSKGDNSHE